MLKFFDYFLLFRWLVLLSQLMSGDETRNFALFIYTSPLTYHPHKPFLSFSVKIIWFFEVWNFQVSWRTMGFPNKYSQLLNACNYEPMLAILWHSSCLSFNYLLYPKNLQENLFWHYVLSLNIQFNLRWTEGFQFPYLKPL
jgi:hypothetical protein